MKVGNWTLIGIRATLRCGSDYALIEDVMFPANDKYSIFVTYQGIEVWYLDTIFHDFGTCPDSDQPWQVLKNGTIRRVDWQEY